MSKFKIPSIPATTNKSIRFPNDVIEQVEKAIVGKDCTFSAFVIEAVRMALKDLQDEFALTCLFISHDLAVVETFCDEIVVMQSGRIVEEGPAAELFASPGQDYTRKLLAASPRIDFEMETPL